MGTTFNSPQDEYAWRRGVKEYADNYHASVTRKGWQGTDAEFDAEIDTYCVEALNKFNAGDVPGERGRASPQKKLANAVVAKLAEVDPELVKTIDLDKIDPNKLAVFLQRQAASGRAA
jgi:hypothetical protein